MHSLKFYMVDVFAEQKYQGNQLAVFVCDGAAGDHGENANVRGAAELSVEAMQKIAREVNFAETAFILSGKGSNGGYDVRIFTPDYEVPFAGHPTLGTAHIIRSRLEKEDSSTVILNLKVGQIPVTFEENGVLWMQQKEPQFGRTFDADTLVGILGIKRSDVDKRYPIQYVSTGLGSILVPLNSLDAVKRCRIIHDQYRRFLKEEMKSILLVFTDQTYHPENSLNVRVFTDDTGYPEDAATGSANGNLSAYLLEHDFFSSCEIRYSVEQGYEMGRPSLLNVKASKFGRHFDIRVGGKAVMTAEGEWFI